MTRPRILVVDDEPRMLRSVERVLGNTYRVQGEASAAEAVARAAEFEPDLALLDIRLPETSGFDLAERLRERCPDLDVIFMTGTVHEIDAQFIRAIRAKAFYFIQKPFDRSVLLTLVDRCLELRRLERENRDYTQRLERQLGEARAFQRSLLPAERAAFGAVRVAARYRPCEALSGDFFDYVDAGRHGVVFLMADVSGHGVTAAMLVGLVKSAFHDAHASGHAPAAVAERVAAGIASFDASRFVTVFCGRIARGGRRLEYVNAGHPAALLLRAGGGREELGLTGPCISPAFELEHAARTVELHAGDRVLVYTDGLTEARGPDPDEMFGRARLLELVDSRRDGGEALLDALLTAVEAFCAGRPADDDRTLLAVDVG